MLKSLPLLLITLLLGGCTTWWQLASGNNPREQVSSSLVDFLYPDGRPREQAVAVPARLQLPLEVGLAFVPGTGSDLPAATKQMLLERVRDRFEAERYVRRIEIIPEAYLRGRHGFQSLEQIARLQGVDVMALISYDQLALAEDNGSSFLYWTIVGAYLVEGSRNDVSTFVDLAVFDVASRKLLLRAPGRNELERTSTLAESPEQLRAARRASFEEAMEDLCNSLDAELARFQETVEVNPDIQLAGRNGAGGGSWAMIGLLLLAGGLQARHRS